MSTEMIKDVLEEFAFADFFENVHDLIQVIDVNGKIIYTNTAWLNTLGYSADEVKGFYIYDFVADEDKLIFEQYSKKVITGNKPDKEILVRYTAKAGNKLLLEGSVSLHNKKNDSGCTLGIFRDVTTKIETAVQLKEREFNLQQLLQNAPDAIVVINPESDIIFWNPAAEQLFGWTTEEVMNKPLAETIIPPHYREGHYGGMSRFMISKKHGVNKTVEITALNKAGEEFYISLTISTATLNGSMAFISFIRDIREKKRNELELQNKKKELEIANLELEQSNSQLERFAHVASHDIKEPIRKIRIFSDRLQQELVAMPENAKMYLQKINSSSKRLLHMVDGILNYATAKNVKNALAPVSLNDIIKAIETDLEVLFAEKKASIIYQVPDKIIGIDFLIYQLFYNLVSNSLKFSKRDLSPVINISSSHVKAADLDIETLDKTKEYVKVIVRDNGIGFDQQHADKIFDSFTQLNNNRDYAGTGLGLALCKSIIERHEGYINAEGRPGEGATFTMFFPV